MDCSPPGSSVHGISQASILEWVAISFSAVYGTCGSSVDKQVLCCWATWEAQLPGASARPGRCVEDHSSLRFPANSASPCLGHPSLVNFCRSWEEKPGLRHRWSRSDLAAATLPAALLSLASLGQLGPMWQSGCCLFSYVFLFSSSRGRLSFSVTGNSSVDKGFVSTESNQSILKST